MLALPHWHARCVCVFNLCVCVHELLCVGVENSGCVQYADICDITTIEYLLRLSLIKHYML